MSDDPIESFIEAALECSDFIEELIRAASARGRESLLDALRDRWQSLDRSRRRLVVNGRPQIYAWPDNDRRRWQSDLGQALDDLFSALLEQVNAARKIPLLAEQSTEYSREYLAALPRVQEACRRARQKVDDACQRILELRQRSADFSSPQQGANDVPLAFSAETSTARPQPSHHPAPPGPEGDANLAPDEFRLGQVIIGHLTPTEVLVLNGLWAGGNRPWLDVPALVNVAYPGFSGRAVEQTAALRSHLKRLGQKLREQTDRLYTIRHPTRPIEKVGIVMTDDPGQREVET
jgi:hypothetical protein